MPLRGLRILSLGLNLPAPVAAQRARALGAHVRKVEPPGGDPVALMAPSAYAELHAGVVVHTLDLRTAAGRAALDKELVRTDVLLTSFRPRALARLGLGWRALRRSFPRLWQVAIEGSLAAPDDAGHDLTYQALEGLLGPSSTENLPPSLWADMCGAEAAVVALHQVMLGRLRGQTPRCIRVGLQDALNAAAAPLRWGLTAPGGLLGGQHAGYRVYACRDGRVALAALEPKFAAALAACAGLSAAVRWLAPATIADLAAWIAPRSTDELVALAAAHDLPLVVCPER